MPEKQPDIWAAIAAQMYHYFLKHDTMICTAVGAAILTLGKMLSDGKRDSFWGLLTESLTAALFVGAVYQILDDFNIPQDSIYLISVGVGVLGTGMIRQLLVKWLKRLGVLEDNNVNK